MADDEFDWLAAVDELAEHWRNTPPPSYPPVQEIVQVGTGDNRVSFLMDGELLDRLRVTREINRCMTDAILEAALGDLDNWRPVGILTQQDVARLFDVPEDMLAASDHNARAVEWWRSQRRAPAHKRTPR